MTQRDWEIAVAIHCQNAVGYLKLAKLTGAQARTYASIYKTEDFGQWAKRHAERQVRLANEKANKSVLDVHSVAASWSDALHETGLSGNVKIVGIMKTETEKKTRAAAYDAWWRSLMTPPLNAHKSAEHDALAVECHEAFVACGSGIQAARIVAQQGDKL